MTELYDRAMALIAKSRRIHNVVRYMVQTAKTTWRSGPAPNWARSRTLPPATGGLEQRCWTRCHRQRIDVVLEQLEKTHRKYGVVIGAYPEVWIDTYRVDFLVVARIRDCGLHAIAIECDGHEHHSKPDDVESDSQREKFVRSQGFEVMRFTGAQIRSDAQDCALAVIRKIIPSSVVPV